MCASFQRRIYIFLLNQSKLFIDTCLPALCYVNSGIPKLSFCLLVKINGNFDDHCPNNDNFHYLTSHFINKSTIKNYNYSI